MRRARVRLAAAIIAMAAVRTSPGQEAPEPVAPGSVVRWSVPGTTRCGMRGRTWPALDAACYYPIDVLQKEGEIQVSRRSATSREVARIAVGAFPYGTEEIDLGDIPQADPSPEDLRRNARDQARVARVWKRQIGPPRFALPLGAPAKPLPEPKTFGWNRIFNGKPAQQPHMGADYALAAGTPVLAAADGTVALADDLFYAGNAVFLDHGDGLYTMYFHLAGLDVKTGQDVRQGDRIGASGSTGRSSGPHLYFGVRWRGARIDPQYLLGDPAKIPAVESLAR